MLAAPASADLHGYGVAGFFGTCSISGTASFDSPVGLERTPNTLRYTTEGGGLDTCTGRLMDYAPRGGGGERQLGNRTWRVSFTGSAAGEFSCLGGTGASTPHGTLSFLNDDGTPFLAPRERHPHGSGFDFVPVTLDLHVTTILGGGAIAFRAEGLTPRRYPAGTRAVGAGLAGGLPGFACGGGAASLSFESSLDGTYSPSTSSRDPVVIGLNQLQP